MTATQLLIIILPPGQRLLDNILDNDSTRAELPHRGIVNLEAAFTMACLTRRDRVCTPAPHEGLADIGIARGLQMADNEQPRLPQQSALTSPLS